jgi:hypothetical protein
VEALALDSASMLCELVTPLRLRALPRISLSSAELGLLEGAVAVMLRLGLNMTTPLSGRANNGWFSQPNQSTPAITLGPQLEPPLHQAATYLLPEAAVEVRGNRGAGAGVGSGGGGDTGGNAGHTGGYLAAAAAASSSAGRASRPGYHSARPVDLRQSLALRQSHVDRCYGLSSGTQGIDQKVLDPDVAGLLQQELRKAMLLVAAAAHAGLPTDPTSASSATTTTTAAAAAAEGADAEAGTGAKEPGFSDPKAKKVYVSTKSIDQSKCALSLEKLESLREQEKERLANGMPVNSGRGPLSWFVRKPPSDSTGLKRPLGEHDVNQPSKRFGSTKQTELEAPVPSILFKYIHGLTNAVRRPVNVVEFLDSKLC